MLYFNRKAFFIFKLFTIFLLIIGGIDLNLKMDETYYT